jgi:hypothetical protein
MHSGVRLWAAIFVGLTLASAGRTVAAPIVAPSVPPAAANLMRPLTLSKIRDMDFGSLGVIAAGTATIDPVSEALSVTGGVARLGGTVHAARFGGSTQSSAVVNIKVPNRAILLTRTGGTETLSVSAFTLDGQSKRTLAQAGVFEFNVGATVNVAAGQAEGVYTGTFDVTIQYP